MKKSPLSNPLVLISGIVFCSTCFHGASQDFYEPLDTSGWFVRLDAAARYNVKANVKTLPLKLDNRIYDDGFVLPDVSGQASGLTWNWGYQSQSQVSYDANNQPAAIVFQRLDNVPGVGGEINLDNPMLEGEFVVGFHFNKFSIGKHKARLSLEVGYGYFASSQTLDFTSSGLTTLTIDSYRLNGVVPPIPPYAGTFYGPGPLIDLNPDPANSSVTQFQSTTAFHAPFDAAFHNFRVGPSFGIDLNRRLHVQFGAGYDSVLADVELEYVETSAYTPDPRLVKVKESKWRPGVYAELLVSFEVIKGLQLFGGGDLRYNNDMSFKDDSRHEFTIELGPTYGAKAGLSYTF